MEKLGCLYVVSTPIGNLADITYRAITTLKEVDFILCEDTRTSKTLLQHYGIDKPLLAHHEHNESKYVDSLCQRIASGETFALISDAGTPLINDPGWPLVHALRQKDLPIVVVPGPCAVVAALSVSGLPTDHFEFSGFLPPKSAQRKKQLEYYIAATHTVVFYESTHRIIAALADMNEVLPERTCVIAKELTKTFETVVTGTASELVAWFQVDQARQKGEFVLMLRGIEHGGEASEVTLSVEKLLQALSEKLSKKDVAKITSTLTGISKNTLYDRLLNI